MTAALKMTMHASAWCPACRRRHRITPWFAGYWEVGFPIVINVCHTGALWTVRDEYESERQP